MTHFNSPEDLGYAVNAHTRDQARVALGLPPVESTLAGEARAAPANPGLHTPAHKQTDPAKMPGQIRFPGMLPALAQPYGESTARNVWVQAVKQDKEQVHAAKN